MGKQCIVIAVLFPGLKDRRRAGGIGGTGSALPNPARLRINAKILYAFEAEPESNRAFLIGEWTGKISRSISIRIFAAYIGLVFQDCVASNRVQVNAVIGISCNYLVNS